MIGSKRRESSAHHSTRKSLYARTHASWSSASPSWRNTWFPNPPTFGYSACAQTPMESRYSRRACAFHDARGTSSMLRGAAGKGSGHPATAVWPTGTSGVPSPTCQTSLPVSGSRMRYGAWSRNFAGTRLVHTSPGSVMCASTSITQSIEASPVGRHPGRSILTPQGLTRLEHVPLGTRGCHERRGEVRGGRDRAAVP